MSCENIPSIADLEKTKLHADDFGRLMGTGEGDSTNEVTGQVRPTYNKVMKSVGFKPGSGDFTTGFTVTPGQRDYAWFDPVSQEWYSYLGIIPTFGFVVAPGTTPVGGLDWRVTSEHLFTQEGAGAVTRRAQDKMREIVSVKDFGAIGDGVAVETVAFQSAITYLLAVGGGVLFIPRGIYWFPIGAKLNPGVGGISFVGDGMDASILHYHEGVTVPAHSGVDHLFKNIENLPKESLSFEKLQFKGTLDESARAGRWANPLWLDYYPSININKCKFVDIAAEAMDFHKCGRFIFTENHLENIAGDGIRARDTTNCIVTGNTVLRNGDDAIALHTSDGFAPTREGVIVAENRLVNCGAIKVLGGRVVSIVNNHLELSNMWGIVVDNQSGPEGNLTLRDITITGNIILDVLSITSGTPGTTQTGIDITGVIPRGTAASNNTIPGNYNSTTGSFIFPWSYDELELDDPANPVGYIRGVTVANNIIRRTRPAVAAFTDYGFGNRLWQGRPYNPAIIDAHLRMNNGIRFSGGFHNARVQGNAVESCITGVEMVAPTMNRQYLGFIISKNAFFDCRSRAVLVNSAAFTQDIAIEENSIDCDPYRQNSNSNVNGTYISDSLPRGVDSGDVRGIKIVNNRFRNVCRGVSTSSAENIYILGNVLSCQPIATSIGFSTANKGIGVLAPASGAYLYEVIDADPTSATYGAIVNMQVTDRGGVPTSGTFVTGAFVKNSNPTLDGNSMINTGWLRLTTGSSHVSGVDWATVRASHVSPAV